MRTTDQRIAEPTLPIERTKLASPRIGGGWISRPGLIGVLTGSADARLLLVDAPVGYGIPKWLLDRPLHRVLTQSGRLPSTFGPSGRRA